MFLLIQTYTALLCDRHLLLAIPEIGEVRRTSYITFSVPFAIKKARIMQDFQGIIRSMDQVYCEEAFMAFK